MRWSWQGSGRRATLVAVSAVVLLVVAGAVVARTTPSARTRTDANPVAAADTRSAGQSSSTAGGSAVAPVPPAGRTVDPAGPRIVRNADVSVRVARNRFGGAFDRVSTIAATNGGYVTASSTFGSGKDGRARAGQLTVRVPAERFDDVRRALGQLGTVEQESLRGEDVGGQLVDTDARLRSLQAQEDSLRTLVGKATNVGEVVQVQNALFDVRQQIEQLQAQRAQLDQAAALATIQLSLYEPGAQVTPDPRPEPATGLAHSLVRARDGAVAVVGGMVVVLGWLAPLAALGLLLWGGLRLRRRGSRTAAVTP